MTATKLTLKLDKDIIEQGKALAKRQGARASAFVTRDAKDFKDAEFPVLSPAGFLRNFKGEIT